MDEDAIATEVKAAVGRGPLCAALITHIGPDWPGGREPAHCWFPTGFRKKGRGSYEPWPFFQLQQFRSILAE